MRRYILGLGVIIALNALHVVGATNLNPEQNHSDQQRTATKPQASMPKYEIQPSDLLKRPRCKLLECLKKTK